MRIHLIAVGTRMPQWVVQGYRDYARRLPRECCLQLVEIPPGRRSKAQAAVTAQLEEGRHMLAAVPKICTVVALDVAGHAWSTAELATQLDRWLGSGRDVALLVGGPDGLAPDCLARAEHRWSLSTLTFPHALVRILVAEQLYRAWSILSNHPYHRA
jgi:23S rRNA (pseudouridine1915-N3)-methyltransferase